MTSPAGVPPIVLIHGLAFTNTMSEDDAKAVVDYKEFQGRPYFTAGAPGWEAVADYSLEWATAHAVRSGS